MEFGAPLLMVLFFADIYSVKVIRSCLNFISELFESYFE